MCRHMIAVLSWKYANVFLCTIDCTCLQQEGGGGGGVRM